MKKTILLFLLLFYVGCSRDKTPVTPSDGSMFGFFFLADTTITLYNSGETPVEDLKIVENPWLTARDITSYNFSKHIIHLKKSWHDLFPQFEDSDELMRKWNVKPFVVVANGEQCYVAAFHVAHSSLGRMVPYIDLLGVELSQTYLLVLNQAWSDVDVRHDPRVERALKNMGIYYIDD